MTTIVTRSGKGSALTWGELDTNFTNLQTTADAANTQAANVASAVTVDLSTSPDQFVHITGAVAITAITLPQGNKRTVVFDGAPTLTNSASLILPGGANIVAAAGDSAILVGEAAGVVRCVAYQKASGRAQQSRLAQIVNFQTGAAATGAGTIPSDNTIPQNTEGTQFMSASITPFNVGSTLEIDVVINLSSSVASAWICAALFRDAGVNAVAAAMNYELTATGLVTLTFKYFVAALATAPSTFKVRGGTDIAGTTSFNAGGSATPFLGGVLMSSITIKEWLP